MRCPCRRRAPGIRGRPATGRRPRPTPTWCGPWCGAGSATRIRPAPTSSCSGRCGAARAAALPARGAGGLAEGRRPRRRGAADRRGQDPGRPAGHRGRQRSTLVVAPTLDLVRQWYDVLRGDVRRTGRPGGRRRARRPGHHRDHLRLGLPAHGAPGRALRPGGVRRVPPPARPDLRAGRAAVPGAVPPGADRHARSAPTAARPICRRWSGPIVYRKDIVELCGDYLADYETVRVSVDLTAEERAEYDAARRSTGTSCAPRASTCPAPAAGRTSSSAPPARDEGRRALAAYRRQREIAFAAPAKLDYVERLLEQHRDDRAIIFTQDNATVYLVSRRFLVPAITHKTKVRERSEILAGLASGRYAAIATSRVLNEGVDIPDGQRGHRHVGQRLGARARAAAGPRAAPARGQARAAVRAGDLRDQSRPRPASGGGTTVLTADLVEVRRRGDQLYLKPLADEDRPRALALAEAYLGLARAHLGRERGQLLEACREIPVAARDRKLAAGLLKLVLDRCQFEEAAAGDPAQVRAELFTRAAAARRQRNGLGGLGRLRSPGGGGRDGAGPGHRPPRNWSRPCTPTCPRPTVWRELELPGRPNSCWLAYQGGGSRRCCCGRCGCAPGSPAPAPAAYRHLFRKLKFLRLLAHASRPLPAADKRGQSPGYLITIDGPFSLFESVTKYGLQLALAYPAIAACGRFHLEADMRWGKERRPLRFVIRGDAEASAAPACPRCPTRSRRCGPRWPSWTAPWSVRGRRRSDRPARRRRAGPRPRAAPRRAAGACCWRCSASGAATPSGNASSSPPQACPHPMVFAVSKHLRVSEAALPDDLPAALYVYAHTMSARAVLDEGRRPLARRQAVKPRRAPLTLTGRERPG